MAGVALAYDDPDRVVELRWGEMCVDFQDSRIVPAADIAVDHVMKPRAANHNLSTCGGGGGSGGRLSAVGCQ